MNMHCNFEVKNCLFFWIYTVENDTQSRNLGDYIRKSHKARQAIKRIDPNGESVKGRHKFWWKSAANHQQSIINNYVPIRMVIPLIAEQCQKKTWLKLEKAVKHYMQWINVEILYNECDINQLLSCFIAAYEPQCIDMEQNQNLKNVFNVQSIPIIMNI